MTAIDEQATQAQLDETTQALEALVATLDNGDQLPVLLQQVCEHALQAVPATDMASVTLLQDGQPHTAACTNDQVFNLDWDQYQAGDGPCLQAASTGKLVRVSVEQARERWPEFVRSAHQAGVGSYLSYPLEVDEQHAGALNLYSNAGHGYRDLDGSLLELYVTAVQGALRTASRYLSARQLSEQLQEALASRPTIEQAKGIIMAERRIPADQAFQVLVEHSQHGNIKLRDMANQLVHHAAHGAQ